MPNSLVRIAPLPNSLLGNLFNQHRFIQIAVLVDTNTKKLCYPAIEQHLPEHSLIEVAPGEQHKNLDTCQKIWGQLTSLNFDRHALLLVLGGGVLGDMGGFCAATYKRGISFILMPTTLLAQVDASVGGKLGVDFQNLKNHIGVFQQPLLTLVSPYFLKTLPQGELRSGFAEVVKHCLIADRKMWNVIRAKTLVQQDWDSLIPHSIDIKEQITQQDPTEKGLRKTLNFGHTIGHALETHFLSKRKPIYHGEGVAAGMVMEAFIANEKKLITKAELLEIAQFILGIFGKVDERFSDRKVRQLTLQDKKNKGNTVLMALPKGIGQCVWDVEVSEEEMNSAFEYYRAL